MDFPVPTDVDTSDFKGISNVWTGAEIRAGNHAYATLTSKQLTLSKAAKAALVTAQLTAWWPTHWRRPDSVAKVGEFVVALEKDKAAAEAKVAHQAEMKKVTDESAAKLKKEKKAKFIILGKVAQLAATQLAATQQTTAQKTTVHQTKVQKTKVQKTTVETVIS